MSSDLENLFEQIIHTEQRAQERRKLLQEIKEEYVKCLEKIQDVEQETKTVSRQLILKIQQQSTAELNQKWLAAKVSILQEQKDKYSKQKEQLQSQLDRLIHLSETEREDFLHHVEEFSQGYDLISHGQQQREEAARQQLQQLHEVKQQLERDLEEYRKQQEKLKVLTIEKDKEQELLDGKQLALKELEEELRKEQEKAAELQKEKERVAQIPHNDAEFKRLHSELESCLDDTLEGYCSALQAEQQELQQKLWQHQLMTKRKQQQQQRQQRMLYGQAQSAAGRGKQRDGNQPAGKGSEDDEKQAADVNQQEGLSQGRSERGGRGGGRGRGSVSRVGQKKK